MKKTLKTFYLTSFLTMALSIPVNAQPEIAKQSSEQNALPPETDQISSLIPVKEGTDLKKISQMEEVLKTGKKKLSIPKQTGSYVRPDSKERFNLYLNRTIGTGLIGVGASSIVQQITETPPEWEQNTGGFFRRAGSNFGKNAIRETISYGLEESFKLDSKFYKSKKKDIGSRVKNAFLSSFTARTPGGKRVFNPSRIAGRYAAEIIATETWYPERYNYKDGLRQATRGVGFNIGFNLLREFIFPE
jgi:hypothetical protein